MTLELRIVRREELAEDILGLTLERPDGGALPPWTPGAHIELALSQAGPDQADLIRHYSLWGDPADRSAYHIGVLREARGRGGSAFIHDCLNEGDVLRAGGPRNNFPFTPQGPVLFIAGGIGITPILPMVCEAAACGLDWRLVAAARTPSRLALADRLAEFDPSRVKCHFDSTEGPLDLDALLNGLPAGASVYACGPAGLLDALQAGAEGRPWSLRVERFAAAAAAQVGDQAFDVICAKSGKRLHVPAEKSILETLRQAGVKVESSCKDGVCGTCETRILRGAADHRDVVLTPEERAEGAYMMICVSRACGTEIELDI
ncbi:MULTISPECIES: PDR/VanB family oxidoreductase [Leisingera]|uniref:PDR/VanB family oxidoreductase n=1 Tax=Leisingera TaxID=191028 RepID=UPI001C93ACC8|nr:MULTISPECIES: PDR/VanB family oxidoreductase [Leisingera]MBY6058744.1 PDR/VanB family oxidoreductase [Leisingera daeponensis]